MMAGATRPCSARTRSASAASRVRGFACVMTNANGRPAASISSSVGPMAPRSSGLGRTGTSTRSAAATSSRTNGWTEGGVSTTTSLSSSGDGRARPGVAPAVEGVNSPVDGEIELAGVAEGAVGQVVALQVAPGALDVVQLRGVLRQPLDREPGPRGERLELAPLAWTGA